MESDNFEHRDALPWAVQKTGGPILMIYEPQSRFARLWLDMTIAQSDAHNFDAARSMLNSNADTQTATQLTTPDA